MVGLMVDDDSSVKLSPPRMLGYKLYNWYEDIVCRRSDKDGYAAHPCQEEARAGRVNLAQERIMVTTKDIGHQGRCRQVYCFISTPPGSPNRGAVGE
jgi:hypothetical protein